MILYTEVVKPQDNASYIGGFIPESCAQSGFVARISSQMGRDLKIGDFNF